MHSQYICFKSQAEIVVPSVGLKTCNYLKIEKSKAVDDGRCTFSSVKQPTRWSKRFLTRRLTQISGPLPFSG